MLLVFYKSNEGTTKCAKTALTDRMVSIKPIVEESKDKEHVANLLEKTFIDYFYDILDTEPQNTFNYRRAIVCFAL